MTKDRKENTLSFKSPRDNWQHKYEKENPVLSYAISGNELNVDV